MRCIYYCISLRSIFLINYLAELKSFGLKIDEFPLSYQEADKLYGLGDGYCCDDCDGDYNNYKKIRMKN